MAGNHSFTTNFNKSILTEDLGLSQVGNTSIFKKSGYFVLSPSIQNAYNWFDLRKAILDRYEKDREKGYLIIRLFDKLLLADLDEYITKMISDDNYVETKVSGVHWKFNIDSDHHDIYFVQNRKDKKRYMVKQVKTEELKNMFR